MSLLAMALCQPPSSAQTLRYREQAHSYSFVYYWGLLNWSE
ncbi:hypothetical protein [Pseudomonas sp. PS01303]|nr:hypothetical protein [Pseudomonas sp. PS01303]